MDAWTGEPAILEAVGRRRARRELIAALRSELIELQYKLAVVIFMTEARLGILNRKTLELLRPTLAAYNGINKNEAVLGMIDGFLGLPEDKLTQVLESQRSTGDRAPVLKKYSAPFLDSNVGSFAPLGPSLQARLLEVRAHLTMFNDEVEQAMFYFRLTFDSVGEKHDHAARALAEANKNASDRARVVVDHITKLKPYASG